MASQHYVGGCQRGAVLYDVDVLSPVHVDGRRH
jgi:hypothetical protein